MLSAAFYGNNDILIRYIKIIMKFAEVASVRIESPVAVIWEMEIFPPAFQPERTDILLANLCDIIWTPGGFLDDDYDLDTIIMLCK